VKCYKRFVVEEHRRNAKHQLNAIRFMKLKVDRHFSNLLYQILQINYFLFHFKHIGLFSDTVYEYALHSTFQLKTRKTEKSK